MFKRVSGKTIISLSISVLLFLSSILFLSYRETQIAHHKITENINEQFLKKKLLTEMYSVARDRALIVLLMYTNDDPFELDNFNQQMGEKARRFIKAHNQLYSLNLSKEERKLLEQQNIEIQLNATYQNSAAEYFLTEQHAKGEKLLLELIIPSQIRIFKAFNKSIQDYESKFTHETELLEIDRNRVNEMFKLLALLLLFGGSAFISVLILHIVKKDKKHLSDQLTLQKQSAKKLSYQATHDPLTNLINRPEFENKLQLLLDRSEEKTHHAVLYLDLDQFKIINDTCGHIAGDELLRQIPDVINQCLRQSDLLARLGGDEFAIILSDCDSEHVAIICQKVIDRIATYKFIWDDKIFKIGVSIGVVPIFNSELSLTDILKYADSACYEAKEAGRNQFQIYYPERQNFKSLSEQMSWLHKINDALANDHFILYAQLIAAVEATEETKPSYELLLRMNSDGSLIPPGAFLPAAERYNQMIDIDRLVIKSAIQIIQNNPNFMDTVDHISINLSGQSLTHVSFLAFIVKQVKQSNAAHKLCFEITETSVINNISQAKKLISKLQSMGVRFSLDDFGSGLSSFAYLKNLNVDYLKIDGAFVRDIVNDPIDRTMVKSIQEIGKVMGKKTIAEFVENDNTLAVLKDLNIDYAQGYGIGKPQPFINIINAGA